MYDVAIIGSGPAGLSAALTLKLHNKSIIWFGGKELSMKVGRSEMIANYPGLTKISGEELNKRFSEQMEEAGLELTDRMITNIMKMKKSFMLQGGQDIYEARSIIITTGAVSAKGFDGENDLLGRGVSYCATCDGFLYKGKEIAVFLGSNKFEHEAEYLSELASKVHVFTGYKGVTIEGENIVRHDNMIKKIEGENKVASIKLNDGSDLPVDGVFVLRNAVAPANLLKGLEIDGAHIVVNRSCETNIEGVYAAGDCTGRPYQITKATGEGNVAAHSVLEYLAEQDKKEN